ncbi:MAG: cryptochrome/photolyase family protein [Balneolaceae bacterium]|nr:cryptochrome/photolyase family protein [Balneolaceae bacterium]
MKFYEDYLRGKNIDVTYIQAEEKLSDVRNLIPQLKKERIETIHYVDPADDWLRRRLLESAKTQQVELVRHDSPMFLNSLEEITAFFEEKDSYYHTDFYIAQRKKRNILVDQDKKPIGGKWSFDPENRSKYPETENTSGSRLGGGKQILCGSRIICQAILSPKLWGVVFRN